MSLANELPVSVERLIVIDLYAVGWDESQGALVTL